MSSRVQKGGTMFRPVAKTRGRHLGEPTTAHTPADNFNNSFPSTLSSPHNGSSAMPPPSAIPRHSAPASSGPTSVRAQIRLPTVANLVTSPSRKPPIPLVVGQSRRPLASTSSIVPPPKTPTAPPAAELPVTTCNTPQAQISAPQTQSVDPGPSPAGLDSASSHQNLSQDTHECASASRKRATSDQLDGAPDLPSKKPRRPRSRKTIGDESSGTTILSKQRSGAQTHGDDRELGGSDNNSETESMPKRPKSKRRSSTASARKPKGPTLPPYDPETPGADLDPTAITMANLCRDTGQGRVRNKATEIMNNHIAWKIANREKRARMIAVMEAKKFGRNLDEEEEAASRAKTSDITSSEQLASTEPSLNTDALQVNQGPADGDSGGFDYSHAMPAGQFNVKVRIGPNGETIVDEESLFIDTNAEQDTENYTHVEESDITKFVNSATHSKKYRGSRWTTQETDLFYDALAQFGENYELISYVLPGRDRKACKNKFKAEDKKNPTRINYCLKNRVPYDIQTLSRMTGKDFSGPTPVIRTPTLAITSVAENSDQNRDTISDGRNDDGGAIIPKHSRTPSVNISRRKDDEEEVLGDMDSFDKDDD